MQVCEKTLVEKKVLQVLTKTNKNLFSLIEIKLIYIYIYIYIILKNLK